nr:MAG TPA: hypothetical protein [Caudoviricetes sp.]
MRLNDYTQVSSHCLKFHSGADYQTQLGVKGRLRRSVNVPRMEATIRLHTALFGYADRSVKVL